APARRMLLASGALGGLGAVLGAALLAASHAGGVERAADDVIADARQILHAASADHHDRVLLEVVPDARDVRRHFEPVREPHACHFPESRVRLLRRRRVHADAHAPLLRTALHRGRLRLAPHRLPATMDELIDSRHVSPPPRRATKLQRYNRDALSCQRFSGHARASADAGPNPRRPAARPFRYPATATESSASPVSATGGLSDSTLSSDFTASPPGVSTSTRV